MWWLNRRLRSERGATAVLVGILLVPLLGFLAIALDVGALYVERAQLQNGADAAALAIAQECAGNPGCASGATALASAYASRNANDGAANVLTPSISMSNKTVTVTDSTRVGGTNATAIRHPFASFLGIDSSTVRATATAVWGPPGSGVVLPLALSLCEFQKSGSLDHELVTIRTDENKVCKKDTSVQDIPGGFGWLDPIPGTCEASIDLTAAGELWMENDTGNSVSKLCQAKLQSVLGTTVLIPIYDGSRGSGTKGEFRIFALASFRVTGWGFSGFTTIDPLAPAPSCDPLDTKCTGHNPRFIQGYFDKYVFLDGTVDPGGTELNVTNVTLVN